MGFRDQNVLVRYDSERNIVIVDYRHLQDVTTDTFARAYELRAALGIVDQRVLALANPEMLTKIRKLTHPLHERAFAITRAMAFVSTSPIDNLLFSEFAMDTGQVDSVKAFRDESTAVAWLQSCRQE